MTEKCGEVILNLDFYSGKDLYSDGDVEDELLRIVQNNPVEEYSRIIVEQKSWPILYHLSPIRTNCVEWIDIAPDAEVLEIGSGCGAITGVFAEKAKKVTCVELSKRRSIINATRNKDKKNIEIFVGNFEDIENALPHYDVITLIGVLEYAGMYIHSASPYVDFLSIMRRHMKADGKLIVAIENKLGMKYWAGCMEDHLSIYFRSIEGYMPEDRVRTFSKAELQSIFSDAGYQSTTFYYPYPDYKLPTTIFSDAHLPVAGELRQNLRNFDGERIILFDEGKAFDNVISNGLFPVFSNSFLVIAQ